MKTLKNNTQTRHEILITTAPEQVIRLEANINYTTFVLADGEQTIMSYTLKRYDTLLAYPFVRVNKGCIVNFNFIININPLSKALLLKDGTNILFSRRRWKKISQEMGLIKN